MKTRLIMLAIMFGSFFFAAAQTPHPRIMKLENKRHRLETRLAFVRSQNRPFKMKERKIERKLFRTNRQLARFSGRR